MSSICFSHVRWQSRVIPSSLACWTCSIDFPLIIKLREWSEWTSESSLFFPLSESAPTVQPLFTVKQKIPINLINRVGFRRSILGPLLSYFSENKKSLYLDKIQIAAQTRRWSKILERSAEKTTSFVTTVIKACRIFLRIKKKVLQDHGAWWVTATGDLY